MKILAKIFSGDGGRILKAMVSLMGGGIAARGIYFACLPFLSRIYGQENFGKYAIFTALVSILGPVISLRYPLAVVLERTDRLSETVAISSAVISFLVSCVLFLVGVIFWIFLENFDLDFFVLYSISIICGFFYSLHECLIQLNLKKSKYNIVSRSQIFQAAVGETLKFSPAATSIGGLGLSISHAISYLFGAILLLFFYGNSILNAIKKFSKRTFFYVLRKYFGNAKYLAPSHLLMAASIHSPIFFISYFFGAGSAGQFAMAMMSISLPADLAGESASKAFYSEISKIPKNEKNKIRVICHSVIKRQAMFAIPISATIFFTAESLFPIILGSGWGMSGKLSSILSIQLCLILIQRPISNILLLYNMQRVHFLMSLQRIALSILIFFLSMTFDLVLVDAIWLYSLAMCAHYFACILISLSPLRKNRE